jgi:hypothetical protein
VASKPKTEAGHFIVYEHPLNNAGARDIMFQLSQEAKGAVPKAQSDLKSEAEKTLNVLKSLCEDDGRFRPYFNELLGLCRYGLVGESAQPIQALQSLRILQTQIFDNEKGRAISAYVSAVAMAQAVGICLVVGAAAGALLAIDNYYQLNLFLEYVPAFAVAPGLFAGVVFSSFMRSRAITFFDLHAIDADRFTPALKALFALVLVVITAAFLKIELFEIKIGKAQLSAFDRNYLSAFVFGAVVGVAQEAIISKIESIKQKIAPSKRRTAPRARVDQNSV